MTVITALEAYDVRFQTSRELDGPMHMNPDPDYSAAYIEYKRQVCRWYGFVFTIGRGNDVAVAAIDALRHLVVGGKVDHIVARPGWICAQSHE